ncbi:hypothetical protein [Flagellimonas sediminis]|uniref:Uncharacterized protein n=1 Tax=Flagellimonas sediminis TaxID=2696468 RepID=A0A6I5L204_9FLAO|nr:hypothetical protein [Allomuricauda sediminis]NDV43060.1 hypothetical protein [Allomuricauda sediminis]
MKLKFDSANPGSISKNNEIFEWIKSFDEADLYISETSLEIIPKLEKPLKSNLEKIEEDFLSETYQGYFDEVNTFRIIRPGKESRYIMDLTGDIETLTIADMSMSGNGYAVHFDVVK